jgi:adenosylhomocysteine nucleosidase
MKDEVRRLGSLKRFSKGRASITVTGVGKEKALAAISSLLNDDPRPSLVLSIGFAGSLSDELSIGDLVLAKRLLSTDGSPPLQIDSRLFQQAEDAILENAMPFVRRDTLTTDRLVRTVNERERLAKEFHAQAVSLEDYWVCSAAARAGVPFVSVRAITDTTHQDLPPYVEEIMLQREARQGMRVILNSLAKPGRLPKLMSLASGAKKAQKSLDVFAKTFVTQAIHRGVPNPA